MKAHVCIPEGFLGEVFLSVSLCFRLCAAGMQRVGSELLTKKHFSSLSLSSVSERLHLFNRNHTPGAAGMFLNLLLVKAQYYNSFQIFITTPDAIMSISPLLDRIFCILMSVGRKNMRGVIHDAPTGCLCLISFS